MREIEKKIATLIEQAESFGLNKEDISKAREALAYFEYEIAFDTIVIQLFEYEIAITNDFIQLAEHIRDSLGIIKTKYDLLYGLLGLVPKHPTQNF